MDNTDLVIREAKIEDASLLAHLTRQSWVDKVLGTTTGHEETSDQVEQELMRGGGFILLINEEPAGSVRWLPLDDESNVWEMRRMGILPAFRGSALSQYLLEAVIHHAQAAGVHELRLGVREDQMALLDLYATYEFELAPELDYTHVNPNEVSPLVMRRML